MVFTSSQQQALQDAVIAAFSSDDLAQLTQYRLSHRLELLVSVNQVLPVQVFQLIQLVERRGWTEEFVRAVYEEGKGNPIVQKFCEDHANFVFSPRTSTKQLAGVVESGLATVAGRLGHGGPVRTVLIGQANKTLSDLWVQFTRLRQYKALHGCLHNLQFKYARLIKTELRSLRDDPVAADNLVTFFREMTDELNHAKPEIDGLESRAAEQMWLNVSDESVRQMNVAVAAKKTEDAERGYKLLEGVLRIQPTRINELLTGLLERLRLDQLRDTLMEVQEPIGADAGPLVRAASALGSLTLRLNSILTDHKEWQLVDNSLHHIDTELKLGAAPEQCAFLWSEVEKVLSPILDRNNQADWSKELRQLGSDLTVAFGSADPVGVRAAFKRLHPRAMWFFFQADNGLKELSEELDKVGEKLRDILSEVGDG